MSYHPRPQGRLALQGYRRRTPTSPHLRNALAALFCLVTLGGLPPSHDPPPAPGTPRQASAREASAAVSGAGAWMFDPRPVSAPEAQAAWQGAPLDPSFRIAAVAPVVTLAAIDPRDAPARDAAKEAAREIIPLVQAMPLPVPRPAELRTPRASEPTRMAERRSLRRTRIAALPAPTAETPSFFEALLGARTAPGPALGQALGYAALENDGIATRRRLVPSPVPAAAGGTAVYDISARVVRLPNGEVLEAHSGLGPNLDNPNFVHLRMRGATPPGTYDLTEREALFHGVRAIRLSPVGGSAAIHGRDGILAHTYMLGPNGDSNGCVVFRDYNRFLQAFLRGEIRRLVVVAGDWQGAQPRVATRRSGRSG